MSANMFNDASDKIKASGFVYVVTLIFVAMFIVSAALMLEDYSTSKAGYEAMPTQKVNNWVVPLVALLPQLGQVGFAYVFMADTRKRWAFGVAGTLWVVDVLTDVYFKANGLSAMWTLGAVVETIAIYTIGSELMMTTSLGMLADLLPACWEKLSGTAERTMTGGHQPKRGGGAPMNVPKGGSNVGTKMTGFHPMVEDDEGLPFGPNGGQPKGGRRL